MVSLGWAAPKVWKREHTNIISTLAADAKKETFLSYLFNIIQLISS
jgi:hypothetical protein